MCLASRLEGPICLRVYVKALLLCWPSHFDSGFLSSADLVTAFRLVFSLLRGISVDWAVIKERLPRITAYHTLSLSCWPLFLPFVEHICMLRQYHEFFLIKDLSASLCVVCLSKSVSPKDEYAPVS